MKAKKIIFGLLPLFLVLGGCKSNKVQPSQSDQPSSEQTSEEPASSEAPVVPPEVREQQAREELTRVFNLANQGDYSIKMTSYWNNNACFYLSNDLFIKEYPYLNYDKDALASIGYMACEDGVKAFERKDHDNNNEFRMLGYVKKTNNLQEALEIIHDMSFTLTFKETDWTYVDNNGTVSEFITTSEAVRNTYADLDNLDGRGDLYESVTLRIYNGIDDFRLLPKVKDNELQFSGAAFSNLGKVKQTPELKTALEDAANWNENKWYETSVSKRSKIKELPFPSQGDKYYFVDNAWDNYKEYETKNLRIGFVNTGDIRESYINDLLADGYILDLRDSSHTQYIRRLKYPTEEWESEEWDGNYYGAYAKISYSNPTEKYPQGIFYIEFFAEHGMPSHDGNGWTSNEISGHRAFDRLPFPNDGPYIFYNVEGSEDYWSIDFYGQDEDFMLAYANQLEGAGFKRDAQTDSYIYNLELEENYRDDDISTRYFTEMHVILIHFDDPQKVLISVEIRNSEERMETHDFTPYERREYLYYANDLPFLADHSALKYYFNDTSCEQFGITFEYVEEGDLDVYKQQLVDIGFEEREVETDVFKYVRDLSDKYENDERGYIEQVETREERDEFDNVTVYETRSYLALALEALEYGDVPVLRVSAQIIRLETVVE